MFLQLLLKQRWGLLWILCLPLSYAWLFATWLRRKISFSTPYRSHLPVICVGNLHSGGTGKTPVVLELAEYFSSRSPALLSRGFKGRATKVGSKLDRNHSDGSREYGDEPWMLSRFCSADIFVGRDRVKAIRQIEAASSYGLTILDDGFQNLKLAKDISLVCIPTHLSPENSFCLPAGMLREPLSALRFAEAVLLPEGEYSAAWESLVSQAWPLVRIFPLKKLNQGIWNGSQPVSFGTQEKIGAFCGLANPERFMREVAQWEGAIFLQSFPDHHDYLENDVAALLSAGEQGGVTKYLTTEKDFAKANPFFVAKGVSLFTSRFSYELPGTLHQFLEEKLGSVA